MRDEELALVREWNDAAKAPRVVAALRNVYDATAKAIEARGPSCWASGRCCNFERTGHRLYVTGLEAAFTLVGLERSETPRRLSLPQVEEARRTGGCPFQESNLCGVHGIRPLGCRVYFCDRTAQAWQQELYEDQLKRVRVIHDEHAIRYRYAEWRDLLELLVRGRDIEEA